MKKLIYTSLFLFIFGSTWAQNLSSGLIGSYPFNGNANDVSGFQNNGIFKNNDGTIKANADLTSDRNGTPNKAYQFDGSGYISLNNPTNYKFATGTSYSLSAWFKSSSASTQVILSHGYKSYAFYLDGTSDYVKFAKDGIANNGSNASNINSALPLNTWHHIAIVNKVGSDVQIYVDGVLANRYTQTITESYIYDTDLVIGRAFNGLNFIGSIDDLLVYNRALTECEIAQLAEMTLATPTFLTPPTITPCPGNTVEYSTNPVPNATSYEWYINGNLKNNNPTTNYSYTWSTSAIGNQNVKVVAKYSCISSPVLTNNLIVKPAPSKPEFSETHNVVCLNQSSTFSVIQVPGVKYSWFITEYPVPAGVTVPINTDADESSSKSIFIPSFGAKSVYARPYLNGCAGPSVGYTNIQVQNCAQNMRQASSEEITNSVYPNPSNGSINIETNGKAGKAVIYDALGQIAQEIDLRESVNRYQVNLTSKGLYTLKIETDSEKRMEKIVVE